MLKQNYRGAVNYGTKPTVVGRHLELDLTEKEFWLMMDAVSTKLYDSRDDEELFMRVSRLHAKMIMATSKGGTEIEF